MTYSVTGNYLGFTVFSDVYGPGDVGLIGRNLVAQMGTATKEWFFDYMSVYEANLGHH